MHKVNHFIPSSKKRQLRVRAKLKGTAERPRLSVSRSNQHTFLQVINDELGQTVLSAHDKQLKTAGTKTERAVKLTEKLADELKKNNITKLAFDRGAYRYHGRVKAVAETLRQQGINV